jgi:UrcA family protein
MSTREKTLRFATALLAPVFTSLLLATGGAVAAKPDVRTIAVRYGDLDLSRDEGVRVLYGRLRAAAANVCGPRTYRDLATLRLWRECRDQTLERAVGQIGNPRLAALHDGKFAHKS